MNHEYENAQFFQNIKRKLNKFKHILSITKQVMPFWPTRILSNSYV